MNDAFISPANPHTIKKFELIEKYVESWAQKLLNYEKCSGLVFIDCMSNSGEYHDDAGEPVFGTPVRVAKYLREVAGQYPHKQIELYFSDLCASKTEHLKSLMPNDCRNFHIHISTEDGNDLAKRLGQTKVNGMHYLLVYDPFDAAIDWKSIEPFINSWGEVILNHMVSDSIRAAKRAKKDEAISKYEQTYQTNIENLIRYGSDKSAFEKRVEEIINSLRQSNGKRYYIAAFPFFNEKNTVVYNLIHCTGNIKGFKLFKECAWKTFGGKSSTKNTHGLESQLELDFDGKGAPKTHIDEFCYYIKDIADYLQNSFKGRSNVSLNEIWEFLDIHPVFPSDGFKPDIKKALSQIYGAYLGRNYISFKD